MLKVALSRSTMLVALSASKCLSKGNVEGATVARQCTALALTALRQPCDKLRAVSKVERLAPVTPALR